MSRAIGIIWVCFCASVIHAADLQMDACDVSHPFVGFGAQIWPGDLRIESLLADFNMKYVRMKFGGNWNPPVNATQAQMDAYVAGKYNGDNGIRNTYSMLNRLNIAVIGNFFEGPSAWLGSQNTLKTENLSDFARLWGSIAYYMEQHNMPIRYIEMFNEPEGDWNIKVPGANYNTVVKLLRDELDSRGLTNVGIVGPGLAYLLNGPNWVDALDGDAAAALECWSTHAWDEGWGNTSALPSFLDSRWKNYFGGSVSSVDPDHDKLIIVTEYATGVRTYNGITFGNDFCNTNQFAQRSLENTLTLINNGANILCYWEAANQSWQSEPMYGFLRTNSTWRPVYYAFSTLAPYIPDNAMVLTKTWNDSQISAAGFIGNNQLVLAFANCTAGAVSRTVGISGVSSLTIAAAKAFEAGAVIDKLSVISFNNPTRTMDITLAPESNLTVVCQIDTCSGPALGDLDRDCKIDLADFSILAGDWLKNNRLSPVSAVLDDYESYADTQALSASYSDTTVNVQLTLETQTVHSGTKSMRFVFNNGNSPYYSIARYSVPAVDWNQYSNLSIWYNVQSNGGDLLKIKIVNRSGAELYTEDFGLVQPGMGWQEAVINLHAKLTPQQLQQVGRVDLMMLAGSYRSGVLFFDDLTLNTTGSTCSEHLVGDIDQNCVVDIEDLVIMSENWLINMQPD